MPTKTVNPVAQAAQNTAAAEDLLVKHARGEELSFAENSLFYALGWDGKAIDHQKDLARSAAETFAIAGTTKDREESKAAALEAAKALETEEPKLQAQMRALEKKINQLQSAKNNADKRVEAQASAVADLKRQAPSHVKQRWQTRYTREVGPINHEWAKAKTEWHRLHNVVNANTNARGTKIFGAFLSEKDATGRRPWLVKTPREPGNMLQSIDEAAWKSHLDNINAHDNYAKYTQRVDELEEMKRVAEAKVDAELDFWVTRLEDSQG